MAAVFEALADPTRRMLLDRMRAEGPLSVGELARGLPMSRQAVTKHLDALDAAGLLQTWTDGRRRLQSLNPAPLRQVEEWLAPYAAAWDRRLARLRAHLEEDDR